MDSSETSFGPVRVIPGHRGSRFPACTSIFIDDDVKVLVDPGAGPGPLGELTRRERIDIVINTHYHFDHIAYNYLFDGAKILLNEKEAQCFKRREHIGSLLGMEEVYGRDWVAGWLSRISRPDTAPSPFSPQNNHRWWLSTARLDGTYAWDEVLDFGRVTVHAVGAPGHSAGFTCLHFPREGIVYTGDLDLTDFGPWYGGTDGDIDLFIDSARKVAALDAHTFITGHEKGIVSREEFATGLDVFLSIIEKRDALILGELSRPRTLRELSEMGLIYDRKFLIDEWIFMWNEIMVKKHLSRLVRNGLVVEVEEGFVAR